MPIVLTSRSVERVRPRPGATTSIRAEDHLKWARAIARGVARHHHLGAGSQEERDLEAEAYLTLVERVQKYRPSWCPPWVTLTNHFRGSTHVHIRGRCDRLVKQLRNAGTYETRREKEHAPVVVVALPVERDEDGTTIVVVPCPCEPPDDDDIEEGRVATPLGEPVSPMGRLPDNWESRYTASVAAPVRHARNPTRADLMARLRRK